MRRALMDMSPVEGIEPKEWLSLPGLGRLLMEDVAWSKS